MSPVGSRHIAYGETKAPQQVDTLRDEACPVCGESSRSYDGQVCSVCNYTLPPRQFQDPDLDLAKKMDLRGETNGMGPSEVDAMEAQTNDVDGDGFDDKTGEPIAAEGEEGDFDQQPLLACGNCGAEFPAGEPMTVDTRDPQAGGMAGGGGPAEGDVCPDCGQGELLDGSQLEQGDEFGAVGPEADEDLEEGLDEDPESDAPFPDPDEEEDSDDEEDDEKDEEENPSLRKNPVTK